MIKQTQYAPIIKGKEGEFLALSKLPASVKDSIVPIVDLVANSNKTFEKHITATIGYLKKWHKENLMYIEDTYPRRRINLFRSALHEIYF